MTTTIGSSSIRRPDHAHDALCCRAREKTRGETSSPSGEFAFPPRFHLGSLDVVPAADYLGCFVD